MKKIVLIPTKNEDWIIDYTISTLHPFVDHILISDQHSTDETRIICAKYPKVTVVDNNEKGHSNKVRWQLLEEARKIDGLHLIFCIDADEMIHPSHISLIEKEAELSGPGTVFLLPWIQLWENCTQYRVDGVWKDNFKTAVFYDDRTIAYTPQLVINDHTSRAPTEHVKYTKTVQQAPLFHFHFLSRERIHIKQAWYRCSELIQTPNKARYINYKYSVSDETPRVETLPVPANWLLGEYEPNKNLFECTDVQRLTQIQEWFNTYGITFFEDLDIWSIDVLYNQFVTSTGRKPSPKRFPSWVIVLNSIRRYIKDKLNMLK